MSTIMSLAVQLGLDSDPLNQGLKGAEKNATNVAGKIGSGLLTIGKAAVVSAGAAVGALTGLVLKTAATADMLSELSLKTGISVDDLQEMDYIGKQVGVSLDTMTGSLGFLTRSMSAGLKSTSDQGKAFAALGVSIIDANGELRDGAAVQADVFAALKKMPNETERNAMAMQLFGRSAMELNPLINTSAAELEKLRIAAHITGAVMSDETVAGAANLQDSLDGLKSSLGGTLGSLASVFVPTFQGIATSAQGYISTLNAIVKQSGGDTTKIAAGIGKLAGVVISDLAKGLPEMLKTGLSIIQGIVTGIVDNLPTIVTAAVDVLKTLVGFILQNLPILLKAALQIIITLITGITSMLPTLIPQIVQVLVDLVQILIDNLPLLIDAGIKLLMGLIQGIVAALPILIAAVPKIILALMDALMQIIPILLEAAGQIIMALIQGITQNLPMLLEMIPTIVFGIAKMLMDNFPTILLAGVNLVIALGKGIFQAFLELWPALIDAGKNIVKGIWQGIQDMWELLKSGFMEMVTGLVDSVKNLLNIHSPSAVFASIGSNMAIGMVEGFAEGVKGFGANVGLPGLSGSNFERAGSSSYSPTIIVNNPTPESASTSVDKTMRKMSYLGSPA